MYYLFFEKKFSSLQEDLGIWSTIEVWNVSYWTNEHLNGYDLDYPTAASSNAVSFFQASNALKGKRQYDSYA